MFSKRSALAVLSLLFVFSAGCSQYIRGKQPENKPMKIEVSETKCLADLPKKVELYINDKGEGSEVTWSFDCLRLSLSTFAKRFRGAQSHTQSAREIQKFFNTFLLKENKISDSFLEQIMRFKVFIVGGSSQEITKVEIELIKEFLSRVEPKLSQLSGHIKDITLRSEAQRAAPRLAATRELVRDTLSEVLAATKASGSLYEFRDFKALLVEIASFVNTDEKFDEILRWIPVVESLKILFVGERASLLTRQDWEWALDWAIDAYFSLLTFKYKIDQFQEAKPYAWTDFTAWSDEIFDLIAKSPAMRQRGGLSTDAIDQVIEQVWKLGEFKTNINADLLKDTYRKVIFHVIEAKGRGQGSPVEVTSFSMSHLKLIRVEYEVWKLSLRFLSWAYGSAGVETLSYDQLLEKAGQFDVAGTMRAQIKTSGMQHEILQQSWDDWVSALKAQYPMVWTAQEKLLIAPRLRGQAVPFAGMLKANIMRTVARLVLRGYGTHESNNVFANTLSEERLVHLEEDFREFGRTIGLLDARTKDPAKRTFKEASFFTFSGNGDDKLTSAEIYELLNLLFSGGSYIANEVHHDLAGVPYCDMHRLDPWGKEVLREACFNALLRRHMNKYLSNLPLQNKAFEGMSEKDYNAMYAALRLVAKFPESPQDEIEFTEMRTVTSVLQYVEALVTVYDKNADGKLSEKEILGAMPRFEGFIASMSPLKDWFVEDIFLYLLYEGKKPDGAGDLLSFKAKRLSGLRELNRLDIIKVIGVLKKETSSLTATKK